MLEAVEIGLTDARTVPINVRILGSPVTYRFRVHTPADVPVNLAMTALPSQVLASVKEGVQIDPNTNETLARYSVTFTPTQVGVVYLDLTVLSSVQPTIFPEIGPISMLDPHYDYNLAFSSPPQDTPLPVNWHFGSKIPHRAYPKAVKHTQRYQQSNGLPIYYGNLMELIQ